MKITMGHGSGGKLMNEMIDGFRKKFDSKFLNQKIDAALLPNKLAFTTDSFVISPIFFPGGDIGKLSICGTVNDLSVSGAIPKYLSCSLILEEGFEIAELEKILESMYKTAREAGVEIVTGDTKVVERGHGDKIFINTSGIGFRRDESFPTISEIKSDDVLLVNGNLGDHAMTILAIREGLEFNSTLQSDAAPLNKIIESLFGQNIKVKFLRDITRGGLASVANELAELTKFNIEIKEESLPISDDVKALSEILGIDPIYMANEGKFLAVIAKEDSERALAILQKHEYGKNAAIIGKISRETKQKVVLETLYGGKKLVSLPITEKLPRIC